MNKILVLHGPNLNLLGTREPETYGTTTLAAINTQLIQMAKQHQVALEHTQSNAEHALIDKIQAAKQANVGFIIINPAAFTHTSIALRDALLAVEVPFIEVHLSNIYAREAFRKQSYFSDIAYGIVCGLGAKVYELAVLAAIDYLKTT